jgi:large repetitive protein
LSSITYTPGSAPPATDMITFTVAGQSASDTVHFVFNQGGSGPGITLTGTAGKDVIFATGNQDTLTGAGGQDQFVFAPTISGSPVQHTVTDFDVNLDKLDLRQFSSLTASHLPTESQQGADTLVTLDANDTILLKNVVASNLHTSDFILHA